MIAYFPDLKNLINVPKYRTFCTKNEADNHIRQQVIIGVSAMPSDLLPRTEVFRCSLLHRKCMIEKRFVQITFT